MVMNVGFGTQLIQVVEMVMFGHFIKMPPGRFLLIYNAVLGKSNW